MTGVPTLVVDIVTIAVFFIGFTFGYQYKAWKERQDLFEELRKQGLDGKLREWLREDDRKPR